MKISWRKPPQHELRAAEINLIDIMKSCLRLLRTHDKIRKRHREQIISHQFKYNLNNVLRLRNKTNWIL